MDLVKILILLLAGLIIMVQLAKLVKGPSPEAMAKMSRWFFPLLMITALIGLLRTCTV